MTSKIGTYVGFAVKSRKILYGINLIKEYRKKLHILIMCSSGSENIKKQCRDFAEYRGLPLIELKSEYVLEVLANKTNCKTVAITDSNLAKAILNSCEDSFIRVV